MNNKIAILAVGLSSMLILGSVVTSTAFATGPGNNDRFGGVPSMSAAAVGTVSSISGNTITLTGRNNIVYTINAGSATVIKNGTSSSVGAISNGDTLIVQGTASGNTVAATTISDQVGGFNSKMGSGIAGVVTSISGSTITITSKLGPGGTTNATTYTINAAGATVTKNGASSSLSNITVGDTIYIQGTVSGNTVTATTIRDGAMMRGNKMGGGTGSSTSIIKGNGEPVIGGTITVISGNAITITNKSNVTYTVDATSATIEKGGVSSSISSVSVGDNIVVQGTVNGNSITASSIIDSGSATNLTTTNNSNHGGFLSQIGGAIGGFFRKLFGF